MRKAALLLFFCIIHGFDEKSQAHIAVGYMTQLKSDKGDVRNTQSIVATFPTEKLASIILVPFQGVVLWLHQDKHVVTRLGQVVYAYFIPNSSLQFMKGRERLTGLYIKFE